MTSVHREIGLTISLCRHGRAVCAGLHDSLGLLIWRCPCPAAAGPRAGLGARRLASQRLRRGIAGRSQVLAGGTGTGVVRRFGRRRTTVDSTGRCNTLDAA